MVFCQLSGVFFEFYGSHETIDKMGERQRQKDGKTSPRSFSD